MNTVIDWFKSEKNRAYVYRVIAALGGVLFAYGLVSADQLAQAIGFTAVVLNVMPVANTSTKN